MVAQKSRLFSSLENHKIYRKIVATKRVFHFSLQLSLKMFRSDKRVTLEKRAQTQVGLDVKFPLLLSSTFN
jgi:hypothetical protein